MGWLDVLCAALWDATVRTVTAKDAATTANTWSGMRVRPQFVEKFFTDPKVCCKQVGKKIRAMTLMTVLSFKGSNSDGDRTLELGANDKFVRVLQHQNGITTILMVVLLTTAIT